MLVKEIGQSSHLTLTDALRCAVIPSRKLSLRWLISWKVTCGSKVRLFFKALLYDNHSNPEKPICSILRIWRRLEIDPQRAWVYRIKIRGFWRKLPLVVGCWQGWLDVELWMFQADFPFCTPSLSHRLLLLLLLLLLSAKLLPWLEEQKSYIPKGTSRESNPVRKRKLRSRG